MVSPHPLGPAAFFFPTPRPWAASGGSCKSWMPGVATSANPPRISVRSSWMRRCPRPCPDHCCSAGGSWAPLPYRFAAAPWWKTGRGQSFAGQFSSYLNIRTSEGLLDAFKRVIASNFGARPLTYRMNAGLPAGDFDMAVLFQCMVDARSAGVLFTIHPTDPENNRMLVSAVPGLGTQAVGGSNPADNFMPDRDNPKDLHSIIAEKEAREVSGTGDGLVMERLDQSERNAPVLCQAEVDQLVHWGLFAEVLMGGPQDMEWAVDTSGTLHFLQSRPHHPAGQGHSGGSPPARGSTPFGGHLRFARALFRQGAHCPYQGRTRQRPAGRPCGAGAAAKPCGRRTAPAPAGRPGCGIGQSHGPFVLRVARIRRAHAHRSHGRCGVHPRRARWSFWTRTSTW